MVIIWQNGLTIYRFFQAGFNLIQKVRQEVHFPFRNLKIGIQLKEEKIRMSGILCLILIEMRNQNVFIWNGSAESPGPIRMNSMKHILLFSSNFQQEKKDCLDQRDHRVNVANVVSEN